MPLSLLRPVLDVCSRSHSTELVLDLLKRLAFRFGQQEYREKDTKDAESAAQPEDHVVAHLFEVAGEFGDEEGQEPADENCYTGSFSFDVRSKHFAHYCPRKWTPAYAVCENENDERDHRQPGYLLYHIVRTLYLLQVEVQAQGTLQNAQLHDMY